MKVRKFDFYSDSSHGWAKVKTYLEAVSRLRNRFGKVRVVSAELVRVN